jgi:CRP-like cAMP-binding protein
MKEGGVTLRPELRLLSRGPLFAGLVEAELGRVLALGVRRRAPVGTWLFHERAAAETLFVLVEGRARVTRQGAEGQLLVLNLAGAGDVLGCAILGGARAYPGSAEVIEDATLLAFDRAALTALVAELPVVSRNALQILSGRMEELRDRLHEMTTESVERRVAHVLVRLACRAEAAQLRPELRLTRQDLAELVGSNQYTVSRVVARFEKSGWIEGGRGRVTVLDVEALRAI